MSPREWLQQQRRCGAPSPGGNLTCVRWPHEGGGHVWHHTSVADAEPPTEGQ